MTGLWEFMGMLVDTDNCNSIGKGLVSAPKKRVRFSGFRVFGE